MRRYDPANPKGHKKTDAPERPLKNRILRLCGTILLPVLFALWMQGCAPSIQRPQIVTKLSSQDLKNNFIHYSEAVTGLKAKCRIQVTFKGKTEPSVRGIMFWKRTKNGPVFRISGYGPFGMSLFECIIKNNIIYLFIPSHKRVYVGNLARLQGENQSDVSFNPEKINLVLAPWSLITGENVKIEENTGGCPEAKPQRGKSICLVKTENSDVISACFEKESLSPICLKTGEARVDFSKIAHLNPGVNYPAHFKITFHELPVELSIRLKAIDLGFVNEEKDVFNTRSLQDIPHWPIRSLLDL